MTEELAEAAEISANIAIAISEMREGASRHALTMHLEDLADVLLERLEVLTLDLAESFKSRTEAADQVERDQAQRDQRHADGVS